MRGILKLGTERDAGTANASMGRGGKAVLEMNKQKKKDLHNKKTLVGLLCYAIMKSVTMSW